MALSLSIITIVADKGFFSVTKLISKSGKALETRQFHQNKKKSRPTDPTRTPRVGWQQTNDFFESSLDKMIIQNIFSALSLKYKESVRDQIAISLYHS